jgi:glycosyltransferase involved in cell wall biosynthesis
MSFPADRQHCAVVTCLSPAQPGFLDFAYRVQALAEHYQVTLISNLKLDIPEFDLPAVQRVQVSMRNGQLGWFGFLYRCLRLLTNGNFDRVMLLHTSVAPLALVCSALKMPVVVYWNEHPTHLAPPTGWRKPHSKLMRALVRHLMLAGARSAHMVMPIGEAHQQDLVAQGVPPRRVNLLPMGVAQSFRGQPRAGLTPGEPLSLVYVGTVAPDRGRDVMLGAMAQLAKLPQTRGRVHLTMVGVQPDQMQYCQQLVDEHNLHDTVSLVGRIPGHEIPAMLARAHVGLCLWEDLIWYRYNPPTKLFEYLVAGLPVLASNIRTHTAYIDDGINGVIFDYSIEGLTAAVQRMLHIDFDWHGVNQSSWRAGEAYLWDQIKPRFLQLFGQARC